MGTEGDCRGWEVAPFLLLLILFSTKRWPEEKCEIGRGEKQRARAERTGRVSQGSEDESKEPELTVREPQRRGKGDCRAGRALVGTGKKGPTPVFDLLGWCARQASPEAG